MIPVSQIHLATHMYFEVPLAFSMREFGMVEEVMIHTSEARLRDSDYALPFLTPPPFTPSPRIPNRHLACEFGMVAEVAAR